jgi:chromosome segregation ATPase
MTIDTSFTETFGGCGLPECLQKYFQAKFTNGLAVHDSYQRIVEAIHAHGMEMATKSGAEQSARIRVLEAERDNEQQRYEILQRENNHLQHKLTAAQRIVDQGYPDFTEWQPTPAGVNALPELIRQYVCGLQTMADPSGTVAENTLLRDQTTMLDAMIGRLKNDLEIAKAAQVITQHELARAEAKAAEVIAYSNERDDYERLLMKTNAELTKEVSAAHFATVKAQDELARITQINDNTSEKLEACRDDSNTLRRRFVAAQQELETLRTITGTQS